VLARDRREVEFGAADHRVAVILCAGNREERGEEEGEEGDGTLEAAPVRHWIEREPATVRVDIGTALQ